MSETYVCGRSNWSFGTDYSKFKKDTLIKTYITKILNKTNKIFDYEGLPETIPKRELEFILQTHSNCTITKAPDGNLYAFRGGLSGMPNVYYKPTNSIVVNPALNFNKTCKIDEDCVVILNDSMYQGLMPIIEQNAYLLAECDISFKFASINIRIPAIIDAPNDTVKAEAKEFLKQIEEGENLGVVGDEMFLDKLSVYNYANSDTSIVHLIELKQYILGTFYQELGIKSTFNMKREAINESEASMSEDILFPLIDNMLEERQIGIEKVNKMYGTNITVKLSSVWEKLRRQTQLSEELTKAEIESVKNSNNEDEEPEGKKEETDNEDK